MRPGQRRVAAAVSAETKRTREAVFSPEQAVVTAITSGVVTVSWKGASIRAAHLSSYTPVVGHTVLLGVPDSGTPFILGQLVNTP